MSLRKAKKIFVTKVNTEKCSGKVHDHFLIPKYTISSFITHTHTHTLKCDEYIQNKFAFH